MYFVIRDPRTTHTGNMPTVVHQTEQDAAEAAKALAAKTPGTTFYVVKAIGEACTATATYRAYSYVGDRHV